VDNLEEGNLVEEADQVGETGQVGQFVVDTLEDTQVEEGNLVGEMVEHTLLEGGNQVVGEFVVDTLEDTQVEEGNIVGEAGQVVGLLLSPLLLFHFAQCHNISSL